MTIKLTPNERRILVNMQKGQRLVIGFTQHKGSIKHPFARFEQSLQRISLKTANNLVDKGLIVRLGGDADTESWKRYDISKLATDSLAAATAKDQA